MHKAILAWSAVLLLASCTSLPTKNVSRENTPKIAKNIVFMIVDGMGFQHVKAARIYNGQKPLAYENFPCTTSVTTCSFEGADGDGHCRNDTPDVTDSAAAATAIATGVKVKNGAISRNLPEQDTADLETILEIAQKQHKSTGIIATKLVSDATPAAFVSHANDRDMTEEILEDMFTGSTPNLVFGADDSLHRHYAKKSTANYQMVHSAKDLTSLVDKIASGPSCSGSQCPFIYGGFGEHELIPGLFDRKSGLPLEITPDSVFKERDIPHLAEMTDAALKILSKNDKGFFLMVESSMPDMISHANAHIDDTKGAPKAIEVLVREMLEVERTVNVIEAFVKTHPDTLVIVTADHETGGLVIDEDKTECLGRPNCVPKVRWTSKKYEPKKDSYARHTAADVPLYAIGQGSERFCQERINNTEISRLSLGN